MFLTKEKQKEQILAIINSNDPEQLKRFIINNSHNKNKSSKSSYFYATLGALYAYKPDTVINLIDTMHDWGYWKDYFLVIVHSKNEELNDYIYDFCISQLL